TRHTNHRATSCRGKLHVAGISDIRRSRISEGIVKLNHAVLDKTEQLQAEPVSVVLDYRRAAPAHQIHADAAAAIERHRATRPGPQLYIFQAHSHALGLEEP